MNRRKTLIAATSMAMAAFAGNALAQSYPSKPITIVVAYPVGGDTDVMARLYAEKLSHRLGQPVLIDNRPGASGIIGSAHVSRAPADGYTLLLAPSTLSIAQLVLKTGTGYDVLKGFTPIVKTGEQPLFVAASQASGIQDVNGLIDAGRRQRITYASPGAGSPMHLLGELFNRNAGVNLSHVPYKGVAPAVNDLIGGHVPTTFMTYGPLAPYLGRDGKARLLAVASPARSPLAPGVPTLTELGIKGVEISAWQGLFGPVGLPKEIVGTLNAHMNEILKMPDIASKMATLGALPAGGDPARLEKTNADDLARFTTLVKELGIQGD